MIDIELIRNNKEKVKQSEKDRYRDPSTVDQVFEMDLAWRKKRHDLDQLNREMNTLQKQVKDTMKANKKQPECNDVKCQHEELDNKLAKVSIESLVEQRNTLKAKKELLETDIKTTENEIRTLLSKIGNIIRDDVVISEDEEDNKLIYEYKSTRKLSKKYHYHELFDKIEGCDTNKGSAIAGHRGYYLFEELGLLGMALTRYAIDFMRKKGYKFVQTPVMMNKNSMARTAQLSDFDDQLYKLENDYYLIATSEQPLTCLHMDENIFDLPIKYVGHSLCFRKEAGAHGKDNHGIFRVHQFEKIEQFVICDKESDKYFDEMIGNVQDLYKSLDISYRVVSIVSKELNDAASVKYDLECYFPMTNRYRELVSCSNCTDYQSRNLEVRMGYGKKNGKEYVHMLNCTVVAVQRMLCCLVENYQQENGIQIPDVLVKYFGNSFIEFRK